MADSSLPFVSILPSQPESRVDALFLSSGPKGGIYLNTAPKGRSAPSIVPKGRQDLAMGVSPWIKANHRYMSPEGTTGPSNRTRPFVASGLNYRDTVRIHGLAPMAIAYSRFAAP